ncbi:MAG: hypothetical protein ACUVV3_09030 [Dehalococcoidia bacterium]
MRLTFLPTILLFLFLLLLAACGSDGGGAPEESVLVQDAEAIALRLTDVPDGFLEVEGSAVHITNDESCAGALGTERDECLKRLEQWGRLDGFEVEYAVSDPALSLTGTHRIFGAVSIYSDQKGATEAFRFSEKRLQQELKELEDAAPVEISAVGDESVAFVATATHTISGREVPVSLHVVDFRRGNVLARIGAQAPTALASVDDALRLARRLDNRILQVASQISSTASPTTTPTTTP